MNTMWMFDGSYTPVISQFAMKTMVNLQMTLTLTCCPIKLCDFRYVKLPEGNVTSMISTSNI